MRKNDGTHNMIRSWRSMISDVVFDLKLKHSIFPCEFFSQRINIQYKPKNLMTMKIIL